MLIPDALSESLSFTGYTGSGSLLDAEGLPKELSLDMFEFSAIGGFFRVSNIYDPDERYLYGYQLSGTLTQLHKAPQPGPVGLFAIALLAALRGVKRRRGSSKA